MAVRKKKPDYISTSDKNNKATSKPKQVKNKEVLDNDNNVAFRNEAILIGVIVISVLLLLSYFNLSGLVGSVINSFVFGIFGFMAYILPFALFFGTAFLLSNRDNKRAVYKFISYLLLFFIAAALMQLISGYDSQVKVMDYYVNSSTSKLGGGLIGGAICSLLCPLFGVVGTYFILLACLLVIIVFITEKAIMSTLGKKGSILYTKAKEERIERKKYEKEHPEDITAKESRRDKKAKKINTNIILKKQDKKEDIIEITGEYTTANQESVLQDNNYRIDDIPIYRTEFKEFPSFEEESIQPQMQTESVAEDVKEPIPIIKEATHETEKITSSTGKVIERENKMIDVGSVSKESKQKPTTTFSYSEKANRRDTEVKEDINDVVNRNQNNCINKEYEIPNIELLSKGKAVAVGDSNKDIKATALKLQQTLESFNVRVSITNVSCGPSVTRYELQPEQGIKVSKIVSLADDIKLNLAAADVRIEAPIPGKSAVGIEVPNKENSAVMLRDIIESDDFNKHPSDIAFAVGKDIGGQNVVTDIGKMPHLLIAGATGSGKSVCINTLIISILYKAKPTDVKLIMIDPKVVELSIYNGIPHLLIPVVTDPKKASAALNWAVAEMTDRYKKFADYNVRDLKGYNEKIAGEEGVDKLPQIVIIVDELADLMMVAPGEVEDAICRLAQMARAAGLHLIIATQRPSVNVITGLIKANVPSRIAFSVSSGIDSRTIIDMNGAEKLLGKGDMLFYPSGLQKPIRVQGAFVSDREVTEIVKFLGAQNKDAIYSDDGFEQKITSMRTMDTSDSVDSRDSYFTEAGKFIIEKDKASIGMLQRVYKIGFNRAARIMDQLCEAGVVGPEEGTKARKILMSMEEFELYVEETV